MKAALARRFAATALVFAATAAAIALPRSSLAEAPQGPCALLAGDEVAEILGYPAGPPDEVSRLNGSCFYYSRSASDDGTLAYRIVRAADLDKLRQTFRAQTIVCGGVAPQAPRYAQCAAFAKLATVTTPAEYCAARAGQPEAEPYAEGSLAATFASGSLFTLRDGACFEARVLHGDEPQRDAEVALLKLLLARALR